MGLFLVVWLQVKIQNSQIDCTAKWLSTHRHIDCNRVPFSIGFDSVTSEILANALSDRYTHTGQAFITRNDIHVLETKLKHTGIEINDKPEINNNEIYSKMNLL